MADGEKNQLLTWMVGLLFLLILFIGGGVAYVLFTKDSTVNTVAPVVPEVVSSNNSNVAAAPSDAAGGLTQKELNTLSGVDPDYINKPPLFYQMKPDFLINIANDKQIKFLQIQVQISSRNPQMIANYEAYSPLIKHELIELFSRKTFAELSTEAGKERMRKEALLVIRKIMKKETGKIGVEDVFFTSFLMQ